MVMSGGGQGDPRDDETTANKPLRSTIRFKTTQKRSSAKADTLARTSAAPFFDRADLTEGDFTQCNFQRASMVEADLMKSVLDGSDFRGADLEKGEAQPFQFQKLSVQRRRSCGNPRKYAIWQGSDWWNAVMDDDLRKALSKKWPQPSDDHSSS